MNNNNNFPNQFPNGNGLPTTFFNPLAPPDFNNNPYNNPYYNPNFMNSNPYNNNMNPMNNHNAEMEREILTKKIQEEIQVLKNTYMESQENLLKRIEELKKESSNANQQNSETIKELSNLKQELENIRKDEEYRRKYVYDVLLDKTLKYNDIIKNTRLTPGEDFNYLNGNRNRNYEASEINSVKLDTQSYFNNLKRDLMKNLPNKTNTTSIYGGRSNFEMNATSKFIDMQTKEVYKVRVIYKQFYRSKNKFKRNFFKKYFRI